MRLSELVAEIDAQRQLGNLSSALQLFVLDITVSAFTQPQFQVAIADPRGMRGKAKRGAAVSPSHPFAMGRTKIARGCGHELAIIALAASPYHCPGQSGTDTD
jgi:hypothetical protein